MNQPKSILELANQVCDRHICRGKSPWTDEAFLHSVHIVPCIEIEEPEEEKYPLWLQHVCVAGAFAVSTTLWIVGLFAFIWLWAAI